LSAWDAWQAASAHWRTIRLQKLTSNRSSRSQHSPRMWLALVAAWAAKVLCRGPGAFRALWPPERWGRPAVITLSAGTSRRSESRAARRQRLSACDAWVEILPCAFHCPRTASVVMLGWALAHGNALSIHPHHFLPHRALLHSHLTYRVGLSTHHHRIVLETINLAWTARLGGLAS
jgi:hypothetical protein